MGTFARKLYARGVHIPKEKEQEFLERLEKLFQAGGLMEIVQHSLYGIETATLRKAQMHEWGMDSYYNYFEDDYRESAGYTLKTNWLYSGKIGWREFSSTVVSAYVLEHLYSEGVGAVFVDGELVDEETYTGWINYLFHEDFRVKDKNPWKLFEVICKETNPDDYLRSMEWDRNISNLERLAGCSEIHAVRDGIDDMFEWQDSVLMEDDYPLSVAKYEDIFFRLARLIVTSIRAYRKSSRQAVDVQLQTLCNHIKAFYQEPEMKISEFEEIYGISQDEVRLLTGLYLTNLPVVAIKTISEVYEKDFWDLWGDVRDVIYGTRRTFPMQPTDDPARPISTVEFFGLCGDDMIYFWQEGGDIHFSGELEGWFSDLRGRYDEIMDEPFTVESPLRWIVELMNYAQKEYYQIFTFTEFYEESLTHVSERKYIALWKLYEEMLHDPNMEEAGKVIFLPDGSGHEKEGVFNGSLYEPRRRLLREWSLMEREKHENLARVTLRRYMALVANVELRKKVFGF